MKKKKLFTRHHLLFLVALFVVILIGTYIYWSLYQGLTDKEKSEIDEIGSSPSINLILVFMIAIAIILICIILVDPFNIYGKP